LSQHDAQIADERYLPAMPRAPPNAISVPAVPENHRPAGKFQVSAFSWGKARRSLPAARQARLCLSALVEDEIAHGRLFLAVPLLLGLGIILWFSLPTGPLVPLGGLAFPLLVLASIAAARGMQGAALGVAALAFITAGMGLAALETWRQTTQVLDSAVTARIEGIVERREAAGDGSWRYVVRLTATRDPQLARPPHRVAVLARGQDASIAPGMVLTGRARLSPPSGPALPGLTDFGFAAFFDGIGAVGYFYGKPEAGGWAGDLSVSERAQMALYSLRGTVGDRIRSFVPGDAGAFAAAIVTDERRAISSEAVTALRLAGLAHIVAISGLNMALAAGICFVGLRILLSLSAPLAQALPTKKIAAAGALLLVTLYYVISGFGVSAERAYLMMAIMLTAVFFDRPSISLHNIALAALVIMILSPSAVLGPSFQMSFAATAALVAGYAGWTARRARRDHDTRPLAAGAAARSLSSLWMMVSGTFITSLIGGLSTAIFSVSHFHQLTGYGLVANLAAMPVVSLVVMPAGLLGMLAMPFGLDQPFFAIMGFGSGLVLSIATEVAGWGGHLVVGRTPPWFLPLATVGLLLLVLLRTRLALLGLVPFGAALLLLVSPIQPSAKKPDLLISEDGALVAAIEGSHAALNRPRPPAFVYRQWESALQLDQMNSPERRDALPEPVATPGPIANPRPAHQSPDAVHVTGPDTPARSGGAPKPVAAAARLAPLTRAALASAWGLMQHAFATAPANRFVCLGQKICLLRSAGGTRIAWVDDARYAGPACDTADLVIAPRARFDTCRSDALMLNGASLRRIGAVEIDFTGSRDPDSWHLRAAMIGIRRPWTQHRAYDWRTRSMDEQLPARLARMISDSGG
jgi:ComEC/Rec2-related protein